MLTLEKEGKTVEEAIAKAIIELGVKREEVQVEVIRHESSGVLSFLGGHPAIVRVTKKERVEDRVEKILQGIFQQMDISVQFQVHDIEDSFRVDVESAGVDGLLIGREGRTLAALEHVVNRIYVNQYGERKRIHLDVDGYKRRRESLLSDKALRMAQRVKRSGSEVILDPLPPADRRIVHKTLDNDALVRTYTVGQGHHKSVVIAPQTIDEPHG